MFAGGLKYICRALVGFIPLGVRHPQVYSRLLVNEILWIPPTHHFSLAFAVV